MMHYFWWIPLVCLYYVGYAWLSQKNNASSGLSWPAALYLYGGVIQLWVIVSKVSHNLLFDAMLFDFLMISSFVATIIVMTGAKISLQQIVGVVIATVGLLLIRA